MREAQKESATREAAKNNKQITNEKPMHIPMKFEDT